MVVLYVLDVPEFKPIVNSVRERGRTAELQQIHRGLLEG